MSPSHWYVFFALVVTARWISVDYPAARINMHTSRTFDLNRSIFCNWQTLNYKSWHVNKRLRQHMDSILLQSVVVSDIYIYMYLILKNKSQHSLFCPLLEQDSFY